MAKLRDTILENQNVIYSGFRRHLPQVAPEMAAAHQRGREFILGMLKALLECLGSGKDDAARSWAIRWFDDPQSNMSESLAAFELVGRLTRIQVAAAEAQEPERLLHNLDKLDAGICLVRRGAGRGRVPAIPAHRVACGCHHGLGLPARLRRPRAVCQRSGAACAG